jgi:pimeloyl-ACP methyl ester carboxylesterase
MHEAVPQQIVPYDPHGFGRHLRSDTQETDGKRKPERRSFYEAVAATLRGADQILIFGHGTGESSAMVQLLADLKHNHEDVARHIVGSIVVDGHHLTEGQLLAKAREFFASKAFQPEEVG